MSDTEHFFALVIVAAVAFAFGITMEVLHVDNREADYQECTTQANPDYCSERMPRYWIDNP